MQDFNEYPIQKSQKPINPILNYYKDDVPVDLNTVYRRDYLEKQSEKLESNKPKENTFFVPFNGTSVYRQQFEDWGE